jgi:hypothetical protein
MERANLVANTLSKGLNDALNFIKYQTGKEYISADGLRTVLAHIARITSQFVINTTDSPKQGSFYDKEEIGKNVTLTQVSDTEEIREILTPVNGLDYSDYVKVTVGKESAYFPWRMAKGYSSGQPLYDLVTSDYHDYSKEGSGENKYLTWGQCIIQAVVNEDVAGQTAIASADDDIMSLIGKGLGVDLTSTISSVRGMLDLAPIQELILNMGTRAGTHHYGVMTNDMYETSKSIYVLVFAVSALFLSVLVIKLIQQKMIATTNIVAKTSLMEGLKDIVFTGVMLAIFPGIFEILLELNFWIVETFSYSNSFLQNYGLTNSKVLSTESMAGFLISSMFLSIDVYINITYLVRAIVISFLYVISPLMAVSYCWGPEQKRLYFGYMRELVGNIFMQSFHAITMSFFAGYDSLNMSSLEAIAATYCFIPITQLFRSLVIGGSASFSEKIGGKLAGQLTSTASAVHKSNVAMRQSKELNDLSASNNAALAKINMFTSAANATSDTAFSAFAPTSNGGIVAPSGKSRGVKAAADGVIGLGSAMLSYGTAKENSRKEGELEIKHSMENIGIGLAEAGIGMGISSVDSDAGSSIMNRGLSTVQSGAETYGKGMSHIGTDGTGNENLGLKAGFESASKSIDHFGRNQSKSLSSYREEYREYQENQQKEQAVENDIREREITRPDFFKAQNVTGDGFVNNERVKIDSAGKNDMVIKTPLEAIKQAEGGNDAYNYIKAVAEGKLDDQAMQSLFNKAKKAGLQGDFGGGKGYVQNGEDISFIIRGIEKSGLGVVATEEGTRLVTVSTNTSLQSNNSTT